MHFIYIIKEMLFLTKRNVFFWPEENIFMVKNAFVLIISFILQQFFEQR